MNNKKQPKIIFLGGGNMAEAIFAKIYSTNNYLIEVVSRNPEKNLRLKNLYPNIKVTETLEYVLSSDDILVLAIKPQNYLDAIKPILDKIKNCTIVSVMAGVSIESIAKNTHNNQITRTMPNTPSMVGLGITAIYHNQHVNLETQKIINGMFATVGQNIIVDNENKINEIVPISSSSIAMVYYFMEQMINCSVKDFHLDQQTATQIITQVFSGALALYQQHPEIEIAQHRQNVTSKKGATEQAILTFERYDFTKILQEAMQNCYQKTLEMSKSY